MAGIITTNDGRRIKHNWTKERLGECAQIHMEQLINAHFNIVDTEYRLKKLSGIIESYFKIENSLG